MRMRPGHIEFIKIEREAICHKISLFQDELRGLILYKLGRNDRFCDDVMQDTYISAMETLLYQHEKMGNDHFKNYVKKIAANTAINYHNQEKINPAKPIPEIPAVFTEEDGFEKTDSDFVWNYVADYNANPENALIALQESGITGSLSGFLNKAGINHKILTQTPLSIVPKKQWQPAYNKSIYRSYSECRRWIAEIYPFAKNKDMWDEFCSGSMGLNKPDFIPDKPDIEFKRRGWVSWNHFFDLDADNRLRKDSIFTTSSAYIHYRGESFYVLPKKMINGIIHASIIGIFAIQKYGNDICFQISDVLALPGFRKEATERLKSNILALMEDKFKISTSHTSFEDGIHCTTDFCRNLESLRKRQSLSFLIASLEPFFKVGTGDFIRQFSEQSVCQKHLEKTIWPRTPVCPKCGCNRNYAMADKKTKRCANNKCRADYTITIDTIFDNTKMPLSKWFLAIYFYCTRSKITSHSLAQYLSISQKTAWFLLDKIKQYKNI